MMGIRTVALLLAFAGAGLAQDAKKTPAKKAAAPKPLPPGKVKKLQAVVMEVKGKVQWRPSSKAKWQGAKKSDLLEGGAEIRTGWKSMVALRLGMNASVRVEGLSRVTVARLLQEGKVFRTKVALNYGKADLKVDLVGLENDFEIATPSATLAVKGTEGTIWWNAVDGFKAVGVVLNKLRAIEVRYAEWLDQQLSKDDATSEQYRLPAFYAYTNTYMLPIEGRLSPGEQDMYIYNPFSGLYRSGLGRTGLIVSNQKRGEVLSGTNIFAGQRLPQPPPIPGANDPVIPPPFTSGNSSGPPPSQPQERN